MPNAIVTTILEVLKGQLILILLWLKETIQWKNARLHIVVLLFGELPGQSGQEVNDAIHILASFLNS